jgi:hypothetical protein
MSYQKKKSIYEPPRALDLSGLSASGQQNAPMGACLWGSYPYYNCVAGPAFIAVCKSGSGVDTSACGGGYNHTRYSCNFGASAVTECSSGAHQQ